MLLKVIFTTRRVFGMLVRCVYEEVHVDGCKCKKKKYADCDGWIDADISFQECY